MIYGTPFSINLSHSIVFGKNIESTFCDEGSYCDLEIDLYIFAGMAKQIYGLIRHMRQYRGLNMIPELHYEYASQRELLVIAEFTIRSIFLPDNIASIDSAFSYISKEYFSYSFDANIRNKNDYFVVDNPYTWDYNHDIQINVVATEENRFDIVDIKQFEVIISCCI
jgi:hypothetical protein